MQFHSPIGDREDRFVAWGVLLALALALHIFGLGNHGLLEPDEGRYANMALEGLEAGEHRWDEPMLSDIGHYDKPPLIYWAASLSLRIFGHHEFAARLPSMLGGILSLLGTGMLAWQFHGRAAAWWSVLVLATTMQFWALSHLLSPDSLLCGFATLGAALALRASPGRRHAWLFWFAGGLLWTLAWWTKATAALVPLAALALALALTGKRELIAALRPGRLFLLVILLGSPWYLVMMHRHPELRDFFFHRELAGRVSGHPDGRTGFPGYHFAVAAGFWLPWWPVLLDEAWRKWSGWRLLPGNEMRKVLPWEAVTAFFVILLFSFVSSKLVTYILPGLPWIAVASGAVIAGRTSSGFAGARPYLAIALVGVAALAVIGATVPMVEDSLGRNSTIRNAVEAARSRGASHLVFDDYRPGAEFYFGEAVWYVNVNNIRQVDNVPGQFPAKHFVSPAEAVELIRNSDQNVWIIQHSRRFQNPAPWIQRIREDRQNPLEPPIEVGDFRVWRAR